MCKKVSKKKRLFLIKSPENSERKRGNCENQECMHLLTSEMQQTEKRIKLIEYRKNMTRLKSAIIIKESRKVIHI